MHLFLVYAVTDRCSFNECSRLKVLIQSYSKRVKNNGQSASPCLPAILVGNKLDRVQDRMVSTVEGRKKATEMNCAGFYEISVREEVDSASMIFADIYKHCKKPSRRAESQKRLSCPPTLSKSAETTETSVPPRQRRRQALFTIS